MDVTTAIESRRSIRKYLEKEIPVDMIKKLINAARLAPSGNNAQPWRFLVVDNDETKERLQKNDIIRDEFVYDAPVIIVCCTDPIAYTKNIPGWDDNNQTRAIRDLSIASSYIDLQATELGLGTCYCGWINKTEIKKVLDLPEHYVVPFVMSIGYPAQKPDARPRKKIEEILL